MKPTLTEFKELWTCLATFNLPASARALKTILEKEKVEARIHDERKLQRFWFLAQPRAGIHVEVRQGSLEAAREFLATKPEARAVFKEAVHCPVCDSSRVQYPAMTRKNILPTIVAQCLVALRLTQHEFYCEDCHNTWRLPDGRRSRYAKLPKAKLDGKAQPSGACG
jgi:Zn finger protein HypA/HybF involved in hydrogenase expression